MRGSFREKKTSCFERLKRPLSFVYYYKLVKFAEKGNTHTLSVSVSLPQQQQQQNHPFNSTKTKPKNSQSHSPHNATTPKEYTNTLPDPKSLLDILLFQILGISSFAPHPHPPPPHHYPPPSPSPSPLSSSKPSHPPTTYSPYPPQPHPHQQDISILSKEDHIIECIYIRRLGRECYDRDRCGEGFWFLGGRARR